MPNIKSTAHIQHNTTQKGARWPPLYTTCCMRSLEKILYEHKTKTKSVQQYRNAGPKNYQELYLRSINDDDAFFLQIYLVQLECVSEKINSNKSRNQM